MKVVTRKFGVMEVDPSQILLFPEGLIGFPEYKRFVVLNTSPGLDLIKWLQSVDEPDLGFAVVDPRQVFPDYDPEFCPSDLAPLQAPSPGDLVMLSILTVPPDITKITANLLAPLVINPRNRLGKQVITLSPQYTIKHLVFSFVREQRIKRTG